ncbi:D-alanyl-D-alanine carboxypeptidase family protein [Ornithinibacillus halotolerans]|uniref:Carboxypeptidase n=1 Tax=Ornithinibacillus halotolerans TaxID=1274357 RepID=A0A916S763_9BACI|nr:D-alanyl-D-alanine carboxypeptidase family protein [Ornithinibacillus halotolerans]GGA84895.1 hypothetical protein GCM10008025_29970 [Ornithinibacillus halotolerans]
MSYKQAVHILIFTSLLLMLAACNTSNNNSSVIENMNDTGTENENEVKEEAVEEEEPEIVKELSLPSDVLQKGDQGQSVDELQNVLIHIGYEITDSSLYDNETVWAITDFQLQTENLLATGLYDEETRLELETVLDNEISLTPGVGLAFVEEEQIDEDTKTISNPYDVLALINKQHALPADYEPIDLVVPDVRFPFVEDLPKKQMRKVAADALEKMFGDADLESLDLFAQSGFRSYERQDVLFAAYVSNHGEEQANTFSAKPGESEHQSGLTMDVTSPQVNYALVTEFGETEEGIWLQENAHKYGFIIRYPEGKEDITGYQYEPWHLRYVGIKAATEIMERGITLEEYLEEKLNK